MINFAEIQSDLTFDKMQSDKTLAQWQGKKHKPKLGN